MKDAAKGCGAYFGLLAAVAVFFVVVGLLGAGYEWVYLPWHAALERKTTEQSKSFIDSANTMMTTTIAQYNGIEVSKTQTKDQAEIGAYNAQEKALKQTICETIASMDPATVAVQVNNWVASHGGCP